MSSLQTPAKPGEAQNGKQEIDVFITLASRVLRARFLAENPVLNAPSTVETLSALVPKLVRTDMMRARQAADGALLTTRKLQDKRSMALAVRAKANVFYSLGKHRFAIKFHRKAQQLFISVGELAQAARTYSASIQPLILLGRYDEAFEAANQAKKIFVDQGNFWRLARVEINTGNIFDRQDRYREALECYERAYQYLLPHQSEDAEGIAVVLHNMAGCYVLINDYKKAATAYEQTCTLASQNDLPALLRQAQYNLAWLHFLRGDYEKAVNSLREVRESCRVHEDRYHLALCQLDLSEIYLELNLTRESFAASHEARQIFTQLGLHYEAARSFANSGIALGQQGDAQGAITAFDNARLMFAKEGNEVWPRLIDLYQATFHFREEQYDDARNLALACVVAFENFKMSGKAAASALLLAKIFYRQKDLRRALDQAKYVFFFLEDSASPALLCQTHSILGQIHEEQGEDVEAHEAYQRAEQYLEEMRDSLRGEELKVSFVREYTGIYEGLVSLRMKQKCNEENDMEEVFRCLQRAKSRSLFDVLAEADNLERQAVAVSTGDEGDKLRSELKWYLNRIEVEQSRQGPNSPVVAGLRQESKLRERELLRLRREYSGNNPEKRTGSVSTISSAEVRSHLAQGTTVLEYFQVKQQLVVGIISHDELFAIQALGSVQQVERSLTLLRFQLARVASRTVHGHNVGSGLAEVQYHLHELYKTLVAPVREFLHGDHLAIAPYGILHGLPFHALFDGVSYLIDEFKISYTPSASIYVTQCSSVVNISGPTLVMGVYDDAAPFVRAEAETVAETQSNSELFLGANATSDVLKSLGPKSSVIHLATHGYFRPEDPMFSGIRLGDGYLSLYDLYHLHLPVELVTLGGCSTGLNVVAPGDELLGLVRGLMHAGVQSTLLTLWDVHDQSSADFMKAFYTRIRQEQPKVAALQGAIWELRQAYPHPYYWAPFVMTDRSLKTKVLP